MFTNCSPAVHNNNKNEQKQDLTEQPVLGQQLSGVSSLAQVSTLLDVSVQALEDTQQEGLQPVDMVSLIQLLSVAADIPAQPLSDANNASHNNIQELSQHFIHVADSVISEDNVLKWQAIKEVAYGVYSNLFLASDRSVDSLCGVFRKWRHEELADLWYLHQQII